MTDTITLPRSVVQGALEALENVRRYDKENLYGLDDDITALREALEQPHCDDCGGFDPECPLKQPQQTSDTIREALADLHRWTLDYVGDCMMDASHPIARAAVALAAPPRREWVGLTDAEIQDEGRHHEKSNRNGDEWFDRLGFARAIEQKLKEKNA